MHVFGTCDTVRLGFGGILAFHLIQAGEGGGELNSVNFCKLKPKVKFVLYSRFLDRDLSV